MGGSEKYGCVYTLPMLVPLLILVFTPFAPMRFLCYNAFCENSIFVD